MAAAERKRGWRWSFVPRRLLRNEKFLALDHIDSNILLRLYLSCTGYGRFECGWMTLQIQLGMLDPKAGLLERLKHLEGQGFIYIYDVEGELYGQIAGYDTDAPADLVRKRGSEILPAHGDLSAKRMPIGCQSAAKSRSEEKREDKKAGGLQPYSDD